MDQSLASLQALSSVHQFLCRLETLTLHQLRSRLSNSTVKFRSHGRLQEDSGSAKCYHPKSRLICRPKFMDEGRVLIEEKASNTNESNFFLHVQTLRKFPIEKLYGEVVIVRFDSALLLEELDINSPSVKKAIFTIRYLYNAGARVLLLSNWGRSGDSNILSTESFADRLSSLLHIEVMASTGISGLVPSKTKELEKTSIILLDNLTNFRKELANCLDFSEELSSDAYIFVNDAFSLSHKILASTVGIARFCSASVAGFHFEEELLQLTETTVISRHPYVAIIGGSKFLEKAIALHLLASVCDGLVFVGKMAFQIMHALGLSVPLCFLEPDSGGKASELIQLAKNRNIPVYVPNDLWCANDGNPQFLEVFPSNGIMTGWTPVDIGPKSLEEIFSMLSNCKKVLWIGPVKFDPLVRDTGTASKLALMLETIRKTGCDVIVVGRAACKAVNDKSSSVSPYKMFKSASVVWEFLKGRTLPGVAALNRVYPFDHEWRTIFTDPTQPLIVDIGSGNGLFLLNMTTRWKDSNFLGLEINSKLVRRCLDSIVDSRIKNGHFISTNATSNFRSIISSYPGDLVLVSIQCPNPDFNKEEHRWRMVQRILVDDITDLLTVNGKVFLQSDIKDVATRMKEQFVKYGKGKLVVDGGDDEGWIPENPFGVQSDWERHVLARGAPMYRLMLRKIGNHKTGN